MNRYLILDRDGTIVEDKAYVHKIEDLVFLPDTIEGLLKFKKAGFKFIVITNQAGIARELYTQKDANTFNEELLLRLRTAGVNIEKIYFCPHHPKFTGDCECRKPKTLLVKQAQSELDFDSKQSIFMGDKDSDVELGINCGGITVRIINEQYPNTVKANYVAKNINDAFEILSKEGLIKNAKRGGLPCL